MEQCGPFLCAFATGHLVYFLQCQYHAEARVFFMTPSTLHEASSVLIENPGDVSRNVLLKVHVDTSAQVRFVCATSGLKQMDVST